MSDIFSQLTELALNQELAQLGELQFIQSTIEPLSALGFSARELASLPNLALSLCGRPTCTDEELRMFERLPSIPMAVANPLPPIFTTMEAGAVAANPLAQIAAARDSVCGADQRCGTVYQQVLQGLVASGAGSAMDALSFTTDLFRRARPMGILDSILGGLNSVGGAVASSIPSILQALPALAQAGIIRGDVGAALAPQLTMAGMMTSSNDSIVGSSFIGPLAGVLGGLGGMVARNPAAAGAAGAIAGDLAIDALQGLLGGGMGSCGASRPAVQAPTLFRMNACGKSSISARTQVIGPDGAIYVVANLGRATRGSREAGVMRRLARDNGFTVGRRGAARGGRRRRPR